MSFTGMSSDLFVVLALCSVALVCGLFSTLLKSASKPEWLTGCVALRTSSCWVTPIAWPLILSENVCSGFWTTYDLDVDLGPFADPICLVFYCWLFCIVCWAEMARDALDCSSTDLFWLAFLWAMTPEYLLLCLIVSSLLNKSLPTELRSKRSYCAAFESSDAFFC